VSSSEQIVDTAIARFLAEGETADDQSTGDPSVAEAIARLPLPIQYELGAVDNLGEPLLTAAGVDPETVRLGAPLPEGMADALDDDARPAASGALQVGDRSLAPPIAIGVDDWSLVWGSRLPQATVDHLVTIVVADSFRPIDRGGLTCAIGVFETANATDATTVLAAMQTWTAATPAGAQASATPLSETRIQLSSCDPGAENASAPQASSVDALINRQLTRLAG
jgi:hypothetical protein